MQRSKCGIKIDDRNSDITSATIHYNSYRSSGGNDDSAFQKSNTFASGQFTDVLQSSWYYESVQTAYEYGLMGGVGNALFDPSGNLTIAEAISITCRIHNSYYENNVAFESGNPWYKPYIDYALSCNIIGSEYDYNAPVSRADFALFISNALSDDALQPINDISELEIPDVFPVSPARTAANILRNSGAISTADVFTVFSMLLFLKSNSKTMVVPRMPILQFTGFTAQVSWLGTMNMEHTRQQQTLHAVLRLLL